MKTYLRHSSLNVIDVKELTALEYLDFEGKYKDYVEKHDFCELCYVEHGSVRITLDSVEHTLTSGEIMFIEPECEHSYFSAEGNGSRAFVVCFSCQSNNLRVLGGVKFAKSDTESYCMRMIIEECRRTYTMNENDHLELMSAHSFGGQQAILLQLEYLLIVLLRKYSEEMSSDVVFLNKDKFYPDLVEIIIGYLKNNVSKKLTLEDVCRRFNYSRSFICRIFKEQTGSSLITYFNHLKIEEAKRLLMTTEVSATELSSILGFSEAKYFGMLFKKQVGSTPIEYRGRQRGNKL